MKPLQFKAYLAQTLQRILEPMARIALRGELSYKEFSDASKRAFFKVARDDYGISGRKTNLARVAILTGFSRKECSRLKKLEDEFGPKVSEAVNPCARVMSGWYQDSHYLDKDGGPLELSEKGPRPSLATLIDEHAGDMPPVAVLKELVSMGIVVKTGSDQYRITRRNFIPQAFDQDKVRILGNQLSDLGSTIYFNLMNTDPGLTRLQRYVVEDELPEEVVEKFQKIATQKSQELLEELDFWLSEQMQQTDRKQTLKSDATRRVGVGVYYFNVDSTAGSE